MDKSSKELARENQELRQRLQALTHILCPSSDQSEFDSTVPVENVVQALACSIDGWWEWDIGEDQLKVSPEFLQKLGNSDHPPSSSPVDFEQLIHPEDRAVFQKQLKLFFQCDDEHSWQYRLSGSDGAWVWIEQRGLVVGRETDKRPTVVAGTMVNITESKALDLELQHSKARLTSILDNLPVALSVREPDGRVVLQNQASKNLWGLCEGKGIHDLDLSSACRAVWMSHNARALAGEVVDTEGSSEYPGGSGVFRSIVAPVKHEAETIGILQLDIDIHARHQAEEALRNKTDEAQRARASLTAAIENSPAGIVIADAPEGAIRFANAAAVRMRGRTEHELLCRGFAEHTEKWQLCHPDGRLLSTDENPLFRAVADNSAVRNVELFIRRDDGMRCWILANAAPIRDETGKVLGGIMVFPDVSLQKKAEEALRHSEENLHITVDSIGDAVVATDALGIVTRLNPAAETLFELDHSEACGAYLPDLVDFYHPETLAALENPVNRVIEEGQSSDAGGPMILTTREGSRRLVECCCSPILNQNKSVIGSVAVFRDITETTKTQERVRQIEKMELIGRLAGGVAHDLNNLITPLLGYSEILLVNLEPDNPQYSTVDSIRNAAEQARDLTEQLLSFGRRQVVEEQTLEIRDAVSRCEDLLRRSLREDIDLRIDHRAGECWIRIDLVQLEQALVNLALNAQEAMPEGGNLAISSDLVSIDEKEAKRFPGLERGEYVSIALEDTGAGMDKQILDHLFEPYFSTKPGQEGTGMGLASVYGIVRRHSGFIYASSTPGAGSCFTILLPSEQPPTDEKPAKRIERQGPRGTETLVVVEDDLLVRELTSKILREHGYTVYDAANPEECVGLFARLKDKVELLVADVVMPGMNGRELYDTLNRDYPDLKVLYMSGYTDRIIARHGVLEQGVNLLQKPFSLVALTSKVRAVLDGG